MKVLFTDYRFADVELERGILAKAGIELKVAQCSTEDEVIRASEGCQALLITYAPVNDKVFAARPDIALCSRMGVGYDSINTQDAQKHGVWVANSPDYGSSEVALHALAMIMALRRHLPQHDANIRKGVWGTHAAGPIPRMSGTTLGVLGYGRIGSRFAFYAHSMFKRVIVCDPYRIDGDFAPYVERVSLEELFSQADAISLHTPLTNETRGIVNARLLDLMKSGSTLVNTSRGAVVRIEDLIPRLSKFDGIGLDVLPVEPVPRDSALLNAPNVILSPHAAYFSLEAETELRRKAAQNVVSWMTGGRPDYVVTSGTKKYNPAL